MAAAVVRGVSLIFSLSWTDEVQSNLPTLEQIRVLARGATLGACRQRVSALWWPRLDQVEGLDMPMTKEDLANERAELAQFAKSALIEFAATELVNIGRELFKCPATQSCNDGTGSISAWKRPSRCQLGRSA
jgi:hypothetical protein